MSKEEEEEEKHMLLLAPLAMPIQVVIEGKNRSKTAENTIKERCMKKIKTKKGRSPCIAERRNANIVMLLLFFFLFCSAADY